MTDKQIIIDGVDVSGCEWIREVGLDSEYICTCNSPNKTSGYCKYNPNCCYKQLKRKEQECDRLRFPMPDTNYAILTKEEFEQLNQLKAENEGLKKLLKVRIEDLCDSCGASSMMPVPCKVYEKTLTEIQKIMKKHCKKCKKHKFYHFQLCCTCKYTDILQKIKEAQGGK